MPTSPFLSLPGAVAAGGIDDGLVAHYGNPMIEQRRLEDGSAIVDLSTYGILSVAGPDRLSWLNSLASQKLDRLAPGESAETLFLDPNGHIEFDVRVLDDGATTWLVTEGAESPALHAWLDRMRFMLRVELADRSIDLAVIGTMAADTSSVGAVVEGGGSAGLERPVGAGRQRRMAVRHPRRPPGRRLGTQPGHRHARTLDAAGHRRRGWRSDRSGNPCTRGLAHRRLAAAAEHRG